MQFIFFMLWIEIEPTNFVFFPSSFYQSSKFQIWRQFLIRIKDLFHTNVAVLIIWNQIAEIVNYLLFGSISNRNEIGLFVQIYFDTFIVDRKRLEGIVDIQIFNHHVLSKVIIDLKVFRA